MWVSTGRPPSRSTTPPEPPSPAGPARRRRTQDGRGPKEMPRVQTDGVNFLGAWAHEDVADVNAITTNDIAAVLRTYGVEAARATILREVRSVFAAYGIGVDLRHLSLVADFMTHQVGPGWLGAGVWPRWRAGVMLCAARRQADGHCGCLLLPPPPVRACGSRCLHVCCDVGQHLTQANAPSHPHACACATHSRTRPPSLVCIVQGGYRACNRIGIESSVSPMLKMSFETAAHFLTDATLHGAVDDLKSPASRLCVGRVVELGTGCVELLQQLG